MSAPRSDTQLALLEALFQECEKADNDEDWSDLPYRVYADWLEETEEEANVARARFVRLLCAADDHGNWGDEHRGCGAEARRLLHQYRDRWFGSHAAFFPKRVSKYGCGFVGEMAVQAAEGSKVAVFDWTTEPKASVDVRGRGRSFLEYLRTQLLGLRDMSVIPHTPDPQLMDAATAAVAGNPNAANLRNLRLPYITDDGIHAVAGSPHLNRVNALMLEGVEVSAEGFRALAESPVGESLTHFMISYWEGADDPWQAVRALFDSPRVSQLKALRLDEVNPGGDGLGLLLTAPHLAKLDTLYITNAYLTDTNCDALFEFGDRAGLTALMLTENYLTDRTLRRLAASPWLSRLHEIELERNFQPGGKPGFTADGVTELLRSPHLGPLKSLSLSVKRGGQRLARELVGCEKLCGLKRLIVSYSRLDERAVDILLTAPWADRLESLDLRGNDLSAETVRRVRRRLPGADRVKV